MLKSKIDQKPFKDLRRDIFYWEEFPLWYLLYGFYRLYIAIYMIIESYNYNDLIRGY